MTLKVPKLPSPKDIDREIKKLQARLGELRAVKRLAEVQQLTRSANADTGGKSARSADEPR
jgi:hypothetical protein